MDTTWLGCGLARTPKTERLSKIAIGNIIEVFIFISSLSYEINSKSFKY